jgi:hypothetical protein
MKGVYVLYVHFALTLEDCTLSTIRTFLLFPDETSTAIINQNNGMVSVKGNCGKGTEHF